MRTKLSATPPLRTALWLAGFVCLALAPLPARAGDQDTNLGERVRARMQAFVDRQDISGVVTVIGRKDAVLSLFNLFGRSGKVYVFLLLVAGALGAGALTKYVIHPYLQEEGKGRPDASVGAVTRPDAGRTDRVHFVA